MLWLVDKNRCDDDNEHDEHDDVNDDQHIKLFVFGWEPRSVSQIQKWAFCKQCFEPNLIN